MMASLTADAHYRQAVRWIDREVYAYFVTDILNLGTPSWDKTIPTAAVAVADSFDSDAGSFKFLFNPAFALRLSESELAFVAAHETLHILLNHLALSKSYPDKRLFNIAADCVINDYLDGQGFDVLAIGCRGQELVGFDCGNATVAEVYGALLNRQRSGDNPQVGEAGGGAGGDADGDDSGDAGDDEGQLIDDHSWIHEANENQQRVAQAAGRTAPDEIKSIKSDVSAGTLPGVSDAAARKFFADDSVTMKWRKLIERVSPDAFKRHALTPSWHQQPRRLINTNTRLPVWSNANPNASGPGQQPAIVLALDTSGSISNSDARRFINLARSIPRSKVKLFPLTFSRAAIPLDLDNPVYNSGGTEFGCIEAYIRELIVPKLRHYPKAVIVVTDGAGAFASCEVEPKHRANWTWLWTNEAIFSGSQSLRDPEHVFKNAEALSEFTN